MLTSEQEPTVPKTVHKSIAAHVAFTKHADDCLLLLGLLKKAIGDGRRDADADPENWGHAGSMNEARDQLLNTLKFIDNLKESTKMEDLRK